MLLMIHNEDKPKTDVPKHGEIRKNQLKLLKLERFLRNP